MTYFPFYEKIDGKRFLIIGGGAVAAEKLGRLLQFTEAVTVIAEDASEVKALLKERGDTGIRIEARAFLPSDISDADYVVAATDDREENRRIAGLATRRGIPVNTVDDEACCTFAFPAIVKRGPLIATAFTSGKSPAFAALLRQQIEALLPERIDEILEFLGELRATLPERLPEQAQRKAFYEALLTACLTKERPLQSGEVEMLLREFH